MVVLADPLLEAFFDVDLPRSFKLLPVEDSSIRRNQPGLGVLGNAVGGFLSSFVTDDNKKIFNSFVDDMGKAIGKHQVRLATWTFLIAPKVITRSPSALRLTSMNATWLSKSLCEKRRDTSRGLRHKAAERRRQQVIARHR